MPHANIWVRRADWEKWEAIEKKSEFISNALKGTHIEIKTPSSKATKGAVCQHGAAIGFCKFNCRK